MTRAAVLEAVSGAEAMPLPKGLRVLSVHQLLAMSIPPREMLLEPILQKQGLLMLHFKRGVGKTHVVLGIAYALASGGSFLRWKAARPTRVLIVDGEMPLSALQERLAAVVAAGAQEPPAPDYLQLVASDYQPNGLPDLATPEGQAALEPLLTAGAAVVALLQDGLSVRDAAEELGIGKSTVFRMRQRAIAEGKIDA